MSSTKSGLLVCGLGACLLVPVAAGAQQGSADSAPVDVVRTELTLNLRPVAVSFEPGLDAGDPVYRELLTASDSASSTRVRVGEIEAMPRLRIGTLDGSQPGGSESPDPATKTLELWLARTAGGWSVDLRGKPDADRDETGDAGEDGHEAGADADAAGRDTTVLGQVALARAAAGMQEAFSAALVPTGESAGQLVLRWRDHRWAADFRFADPPEPDEGEEEEEPELAEESDEANAAVVESEGDETEGEEPEEDEGPRVANETESLRFDSDTSAGARFLRLSERHESAVELPGDARLAVLFWQEQSVDLEDFAGVETLAEGEVVRLTRAAVIRLRNETPLRFGDVTLPTGNLAPGFAGSYGLWLKRSGSGWRLVFNHEADSWGTQHDPAFDAAEIDLAYSQDGLDTRPLGAALVPATADAGRLVIHWGVHEWAADYTIPE
ncbi:MAG: DUF2911 domain-containing protein [Acidobacteria bacterium]|nr:DUF2911 domain-containing protein [Acidobacteriota bacterium]MYH30492.1 DUF2911 domain-containing protein [Acidobacteriota bacterium]